MPEEYGRTTKTKKVKLPGGDSVPVRVITEISFVDPTDRYQETRYTVDNSAQSAREVHVDTIHAVPVDADGVATGGAGGASLDVERIDTWPIKDSVDRGQESQITIDNKTGGDTEPPSFTTHEKTHLYRYYKNPQTPDDGGPWVEVEMIDELRVKDPTDRGQDSYYTLNNPKRGDPAGQADENDPDISDTDNGVDPPWRLDPFQNIVNFHESSNISIYVGYIIRRGGTGLTIHHPPCNDDPPPNTSPYGLADNYMTYGYGVERWLFGPTRGTTSFNPPFHPVDHSGWPDAASDGDWEIFGYNEPADYGYMITLDMLAPHGAVAHDFEGNPIPGTVDALSVDFVARAFLMGSPYTWRCQPWYLAKYSGERDVRRRQLYLESGIVDSAGVSFGPGDDIDSFSISFAGVTVDFEGDTYQAVGCIARPNHSGAFEAESEIYWGTGLSGLGYKYPVGNAQQFQIVCCRVPP